jgi:hypothetical protein
MPADERTNAQIREEITNERRELTNALADLREDVRAARRIPIMVGGALAAVAAAIAAAKHFKN